MVQPLSDQKLHFGVLSGTDIDVAFAIEQRANPYPWPKTAFVSSFSELYLNYKLLVDDNLVGFIICKLVADQAELFNICVTPDAQGKGYGKALLVQLISELSARKATELWLEVRASNTAAIALYEKLGFNCVDVRRNYYINAQGSEDAHIMCLYLP